MIVIDRFEGDWAVVEYGESVFNIPKAFLPKEVKEGDVLKIVIDIDKNATNDRLKKINNLVDDLFE